MRAKGLAATPTFTAMPTLPIYGALFAAAVTAFCLERLLGDRLGLSANVLAVIGDATCGWSWLVVRALFRPPSAQRSIWPLLLVLALVVAGALLRLSGDDGAAGPRMVDNLATLLSSTLLLLAAVEPLRGLRRDMPSGERRFRIAFAAGYAAILAVAVVWVNGAPDAAFAADHRAAIKTACAGLALVGMALAIVYRGRNPLPETAKPARRIAAETGDLGERLMRLMADEAVFGRHDLRIADVARRIGEPEHRVSQAITGTLGFRNFNHLANRFRVEEAKRRLGDPALDRLPVLTIAYDCGFASIGPFNRAFKAETGMTPMQFRQARR